MTTLLFWTGVESGTERALPLEHTVLADVSFFLLCLILVLGALARFVPRLRPVVRWGRELGIAMFVTGGLHALLLDPDLDFLGLVALGFELPEGLWGAANWVGWAALAIALVLAAISNDWSQRSLGRGWKFLQRQSYTLFVLVWLHTAAFVLMEGGHGASLTVGAFLGATVAVAGLQFGGFVHTIRASRGPSPHRVPPVTRGADPSVRRVLRWIGVAGLWTAFIVGSWLFAMAPSDEDLQMQVFCDRYNELGRPVPSGTTLDELLLLLPPDWDRSDLFESLEHCSPG